MSTQHTPGPWRVRAGLTMYVMADLGNGWLQEVCAVGPAMPGGYGVIQNANARLIASAPEHQLALYAIANLGARWESFQGIDFGEFCIGGVRYPSKLDEFGCPVIDDFIRAAIAKAKATP